MGFGEGFASGLAAAIVVTAAAAVTVSCTSGLEEELSDVSMALLSLDVSEPLGVSATSVTVPFVFRSVSIACKQQQCK